MSVSHIALVTDSAIGNFAEVIVGHLVKTEIKVFPYREYEKAK